MSRLISKATGNFTSASTWALVDDTSFLDSEANSTALSTSYVNSSSFTPGAITIDGVAIKIANMTTGAATLSLELYNVTDALSVTTATINLSDVQNTLNATAYNRGWVFLKFSSSQTLTAAKAYRIGLKLSSTASQGLTVYRNATAGNWSRMLRTTTTQAPASGEQLHIMGEWTAAGSQTAFTVTMDNTATTSFGPTVSGGPPQGMTVNKGGTLAYGTSAATNYYLKLKGVLGVCDGGVLTLGTTGTRIPTDSSAVLEFDSVANVDSGLTVFHGGTFRSHGFAKFTTSFQTKLNTDEAVSSTVLGVADTTGWANGDEIALAPTARTYNQFEKRTISTVDSSTQVTVSAGLTNAHSGTSPTQAEVGNLTRHCKIRGISDTLQGYIFLYASAIFDCSYTEISRMGSATSNKRGIDSAINQTGTLSLDYCVLRDFIVTSSLGINIASGVTNLSTNTITNCVFYNINSAHLQVTTFQGVTNPITVTGCLFIGNVSSAWSVALPFTCTCQNVNVSGMLFGIMFSGGGASVTINDIVSHSNNGVGIGLGTCGDLELQTISNLTAWRNAATGISTSNTFGLSGVANMIFSGLVSFGNGTAGLSLGIGSSNLTFDGYTAMGDTTFAQPVGVDFTNVCVTNVYFNNADLGTASGIYVAHSTADVRVNNASGFYSESISAFFRNSKFSSTTEVSSQASLPVNSIISSQRHDQTSGNHKSWMGAGTVSIDTSIYKTASPSARLTPTSATRKLNLSPYAEGFKKTVDSGGTVSFSCYVRKSNTGAGDATTYNGNQPRLILRKNSAMGITSDTVLATATSASNGAWELLSGTSGTVTDDGVLEFYVDCDGTVGWINVDDLS